MSYFITDIKKIYGSRTVKWMLIFLLIIMIADPISIYPINARYKDFFETIGANPFQFWLLMNSSGWGHTVFHTVFWMLPVLSTGLIYYDERKSSLCELLLVRGSRLKYYFSKIAATFGVTFINFFLLLSINILVTYLIFSADAPKTEQYMYLIPKTGMFSYAYYQKNPLSMVFLYTFLNALTIALLSLLALSIHIIAALKNRYAAILVPFISLYLLNYVTSLMLRNNLNYNLKVIIQPRAACSILDIIHGRDVIMVFALVALADFVLLGIGYIRSRETI